MQQDARWGKCKVVSNPVCPIRRNRWGKRPDDVQSRSKPKRQPQTEMPGKRIQLTRRRARLGWEYWRQAMRESY